MQKVNFIEKLSKFSDTWSPKVISELNDYQFKLAKLSGEFVWHKHDETDEAFIVIKGELIINLRDQDILLKEGELFVVPKGVEHRPVAKEECHVLLIEPSGVVNTGDISNEMTAENDVWI